jgi:hypothetical protein
MYYQKRGDFQKNMASVALAFGEREIRGREADIEKSLLDFWQKEEMTLCDEDKIPERWVRFMYAFRD